MFLQITVTLFNAEHVKDVEHLNEIEHLKDVEPAKVVYRAFKRWSTCSKGKNTLS